MPLIDDRKLILGILCSIRKAGLTRCLGIVCIFLLISVFSSSCYRHHLYVQEEWVDQNFLASTHVNSPDPRLNDPPEGQRLLIGWDFPRSIFTKDCFFVVNVRFWDQTQEVLSKPILRKRGSCAFFFSKKKILTYRVDVISQENEILETWKHHFWTEPIEIQKTDK